MVHKFLTQYTTGVEMQSENKKINNFFYIYFYLRVLEIAQSELNTIYAGFLT